jgi:hypothetical protein
MTIFPVLARFAASAARVFGSPSALRSRRVRVLSTGKGSDGASGGGVLGRGDDAADEECVEPTEHPGVDSSGVDSSSSGSSISMASGTGSTCVRDGGGFFELRVRFAMASESDEEPDDSSNVRLGERWVRRVGDSEESFVFAGCTVIAIGGDVSTSI